MANVKIVTESSIRGPYIQIDICLREANLLIKNHKNITDILLKDIGKAVTYIENRGGDE